MNDEGIPADAAATPSKSARKRAMLDLQHTADALASLSAPELERLGVPGDIVGALAELARLKPGGARKRQVKYCARLLERIDHEQVDIYLADRQAASLAVNQVFHALERWRDRLITEGDDALGDYLAAFPGVDRQALRQIVRAARKETDREGPRPAGKKLFRFLRDEHERRGREA